MRQTNLSVFITHKGCPHRCSFCNQSEINGSVPITAEELRLLLENQAEILSKNDTRAEISFFGGSFTAVDESYMTELLETAGGFVKRYPEIYSGIRCSTRPDCIDERKLDLLKSYGMTAIELGAQSMDDEVLLANERGHSAEDVRTASRLIRSRGFSLGLQMMTGLYRDTLQKSSRTADEIIKLKPDTVRIYPTVILKNTRLGELFSAGEYKSFGFDETVQLCAELLERFCDNGIKVIRLGLHASPDIEKAMLGGVYHPAFRALCESRLYYEKMLSAMKKIGGERFVVYTDKRNVGRVAGQGGANRAALLERGITFKIKEMAGEKLRVVPAPTKG